MNKELVILDICTLGFSKERAEQILDDYLSRGGLYCLQQYGDQFSLFSPHRNVFDVLLKHHLFL